MDAWDELPETKIKTAPKLTKVKDKRAAPVQITAEQLIREAKERELELVPPPPNQKISDEAELKSYRLRKRKNFEDALRKNRSVMTNWIKYAQWEESQKEVQRARSVWERALDVDHRNITVWLKYAEMEMKARQINHARNVWDRAVTLLPRANQFWYKYTYMEEMLKNIAGCRQVFERWMEWEPEEQAWHSYINFELRYKELERVRGIYERFVLVHSVPKNWIRYAKFEEKHSYISGARKVFERAIAFFGEVEIDEKLIVGFAKFEESQREHERVRVIYKYALDNLPKESCQEVYKQYTVHEKKFGSQTAIEDVIVSKRKFQYEEEIKQNPLNYDAWFDYLRLAENEEMEAEQIRELYERAISNIPPSGEKRMWRRYIYLWIKYALYEEVDASDPDRARSVYLACLELLRGKGFTFAKIWIMLAHLHIRQKNLSAARKTMGVAIGKNPKDKLFREYIDMEIQLREFDRCRTIYRKFLEFNPENVTTWIKFAELEDMLGDYERARGIYELAIDQPQLDMPENLWKSYIDFEIERSEFDRTRELYKRLLQRTSHVKVWLSFAKFELMTDGEEEDEKLKKCRGVYRLGADTLKSNSPNDKEERLLILESWKEFESDYGSESDQKALAELMPKKVKKRRKVQSSDGLDAGWEEYFDYIFPDDKGAQPNLKLLEKAKAWKHKMETQGQAQAPEPVSSTAQATKKRKVESKGDSDNDDEDDDSDVSSTSSSDSENEKERVSNKGKERKQDDNEDSDSSSSSSSSESENEKGKVDKVKQARANGGDDDDSDSSSSSSEESDDA